MSEGMENPASAWSRRATAAPIERRVVGLAGPVGRALPSTNATS